MPGYLFHIVDRGVWSDATNTGRYLPESFGVDGFIHLSEHRQILRPANLRYRGQLDLVLLVIDTKTLTAEIVYEAGSLGEDEKFPHLYGELDTAAVVEVVPFPPGADGLFVLPVELGLFDG